jgi:hypothetical protein
VACELERMLADDYRPARAPLPFVPAAPAGAE